MTYTKEERQEEMNIELMEELKAEKVVEMIDGTFFEWIIDNEKELISGFIDEYNPEWINYCKEQWNLENEE